MARGWRLGRFGDLLGAGLAANLSPFRIALKENASSDNTVRNIFSGLETLGYAGQPQAVKTRRTSFQLERTAKPDRYT